MAIGEGELVVDLLMLRYGLTAASAIGLGVVLLAINSIFLVGIHCLALGGIRWDVAAFIGQYFGDVLLKRIFASIAIVHGGLFVGQYLLAYVAR